ncbi:MAG: FecR domain-containing protein [Deltaproteobacteria bacterium]|nr:FecR domain-containing protein [Deltaproteobacteria bacterium]
MHINAIKRILAAPQEEVRVNRIWQGIEARRHVPVRNGWAVKSLMPAGAAISIVLLLILIKEPTSRPLQLADNTPLPAMLKPGRAVETVLSDGSRIRMNEATQLAVLNNSSTDVHLQLQRGSVLFDVVPNRDKKWTIVCDRTEIIVVGTRFKVSRSQGDVVVSVSRGAVLVKSDRIDGGIRRLNAGKSLTVSHHSKLASPNPSSPQDLKPVKNASPAPENVADTTSDEEPVSPDDPKNVIAHTPVDVDVAPVPRAQPGTRVIWKEHAMKGNYQDAYKELGAQGVATLSKTSHSPKELFALADVARLGGHPRDAVMPLEKMIRQFPENQKSGLAAYTLARLYMEQLNNPGEAAVMFEYAISLNLPAAMVETAMAKRVQAFMKIGDVRKREAGTAYLQKYPKGRYTKRVQEWMRTPTH